jgi:hypothetical protein
MDGQWLSQAAECQLFWMFGGAAAKIEYCTQFLVARPHIGSIVARALQESENRVIGRAGDKSDLVRNSVTLRALVGRDRRSAQVRKTHSPGTRPGEWNDLQTEARLT